MASLLPVYGLVRYQSIAFQITAVDAADTITNVRLLTTSGLAALTVSGPLRTFLTDTYASDAAAETAFRLIGGQIETRQLSGTATDTILLAWTAAGPSAPFLTITNAALLVDQVFEMRICVPHTIVR